MKTIQQRVRAYVKKHPTPAKTTEVLIFTHGDMTWDRNAITGEKYERSAINWRTKPNWYYCHVAPNSINEIGYVDFDKKLQVGELSIIRINNRSFKKYPAPRWPEFVARFFFVSGDRRPYNNLGEVDYRTHHSLPFTTWGGPCGCWSKSFLGHMSKRWAYARPGILWSDFVGSSSFLDGNCHSHSVDNERAALWELCAWFTTMPPRFQLDPNKPTPFTKTREMLNSITNWQQASKDNEFCFAQYKQYQILRHRSGDSCYYKEELWDKTVYYIWNRNSKRPSLQAYLQRRNDSLVKANIWDVSHNSLFNSKEEIAKLPFGEDYLQFVAPFAAPLRNYLYWLNPITQMIVKTTKSAAALEQCADISAVFGKVYCSQKKLLQKLGLNAWQFRWMVENHFPKTVIPNLKKVWGQNLSHLTEEQFYGSIIRSLWFERRLMFHLDERYPNSPQKTLLLKKLCEGYPSVSNLVSALTDTFDMLGQMGRDERVSLATCLNPEKVQQLHDKTLEQYQRYLRLQQAERAKLMQEQFDTNQKQRRKYEYEEDKYLIRLPASMQEIRDEGEIQHICIGSYAQRYAQGNTNLFFMRKKNDPNTPFLAIEVDPIRKTVVQIHGKFNAWAASVDPQAVPTLYRWIEKNGFECQDRILLLQATGYAGTGTLMPKPEY